MRARPATMLSEVIDVSSCIGPSLALSRPWSASTALFAYC
jgi:hypothetical protein